MNNVKNILASTDKCITECCEECVDMCACMQYTTHLQCWSVKVRRGMATYVQGHARCRHHVPYAKFACAVKAKVSTGQPRETCAVQVQCPDALVYVLCGNPDITREIHMRSERKYPVTVGNIDCRVLKYKVLPPKQPQDTRAQMFVM